jgi:hypothetical protein
MYPGQIKNNIIGKDLILDVNRKMSDLSNSNSFSSDSHNINKKIV